MFNDLFVIVLAVLAFRALSAHLPQAGAWRQSIGQVGFGEKPAAHGASSDPVPSGDDGSWNDGWSHCINPATGLPMVSGSCVGFDTGGNLYGFSPPLEIVPAIEPDLFSEHRASWEENEPSWMYINPVTGLPMVSDSIGGFDMGGNSYGSSSYWPSEP